MEFSKPVGRELVDGVAGLARQIVQELFIFLNVLARLIHLFEGLLLLIDHRVELLLHLVHRRLQLVLVVEFAHLARHLRQQIFDALGLLLALLEPLLHQPAHRLLQIARVVHVLVQLIEHRLGVEGISAAGGPAAIADMHHEISFGGSVEPRRPCAYLP